MTLGSNTRGRGRGMGWSLVCAVSLGAVLAPTVAHAQAAAVDGREAFERGVTALDEGRYRDAIEALERSRRAREVAVVNYDLGLAYRGVGQNIDAIAAFERYLAAPDLRSESSEIEAVRRAVAELRATLARIALGVTPPTATVTVDGHVVGFASGTVTVDPGHHVVEVTADGFRPARREVGLERGARSSLQIVLESAIVPSRLIVVPSVADAVTTIDGVRQPTAVVDRVLPPGTHTVSIRAVGYDVFDRAVTVGVSTNVRVEARLARSHGVPWFVPAAIAGAALVAGGIIAGAVVATSTSTPTTLPYSTSLGTFNEGGSSRP